MSEKEQQAKTARKSRIIAVIFLVLLSVLYFRFNTFKDPQHIDVTALHLLKLSGEPFAPSLFEGKAVVLNFWAPWCAACVIEAPSLQRLQEKHPNDLAVIGVVYDANTYREAVLFADERHLTFPLARTSNQISKAIGTLAGVPTTFYISRSGEVVHLATGAITEEGMEKYAQDALAGR